MARTILKPETDLILACVRQSRTDGLAHECAYFIFPAGTMSLLAAAIGITERPYENQTLTGFRG